MNGMYADTSVSAFLQGLARLRNALGVIDQVARPGAGAGVALTPLPPAVDAATSARLVRERLGLPCPPTTFEQSMDRLISQHVASASRGAAPAPGTETDAAAGDGSSMSQSMNRIITQHGGRREAQPGA